MDPSETDATASLLAESFAESMLVPGQYTSILAFLVRQYLMERRELVPHATMLVGYYRRSGVGEGEEEGEEEGEVLAGTAEVSFDARGANASPPTPVPPRDLPYICNMTVRKGLRRKGIGWQLLKACEELICKTKGPSDVYLHCRVVDIGPYKMYKKAEYEVVKTDNFLIWLTLQRRKHLMRKQLKCE
ncbi:hypothetical protein QJS10_CPB15g01827 [Acorus calamus]|uniref:N-acetyltransferase domain-containing protein n=1 Tax=Acorus calamus TaxID=4465 RepID=A0AAV9D6J5_ACOCL|nr:hypothetical protein QJS10_CPB15g01827 [Acorus calamus]